jgi:hypothetical protein
MPANIRMAPTRDGTTAARGSFGTLVWRHNVQAGWSRTPKPTAFLTHADLLNRDSESFGPRFRGAMPTFMVGSGPRFAPLETESAGLVAGSSKTPWPKGPKRQTPGCRSLGAGR